MGSGYKRLYEATERENQTLTKLVEAQDEMIEKFKVLVAAQQELIETLKKQADELQDQFEQQPVRNHSTGLEKT